MVVQSATTVETIKKYEILKCARIVEMGNYMDEPYYNEAQDGGRCIKVEKKREWDLRCEKEILKNKKRPKPKSI